MEERTAQLVSRAGALAICVFVLVGVGYASCVAVLLVCPSIVPEPMYWAMDLSGDVFRISTFSLGYWMTACVVALGLALAITLLAGRALAALGELAQSASGENR
ncbi:hypothetical protein IT072_12215 [Leifsonia sp. ZF2019]|uniref:hypothetical protein n=1 Tax=Leifsonia sp. ZF2019 TaxID=2781978 RepID=UPI001CBC1B24|nr:hypothetical protein [Leifsonia sp. ZF2019]UAJ78049.1 hypothetical protein IT072_12215 [Leifsonia sp. ZF2019]